MLQLGFAFADEEVAFAEVEAGLLALDVEVVARVGDGGNGGRD